MSVPLDVNIIRWAKPAPGVLSVPSCMGFEGGYFFVRVVYSPAERRKFSNRQIWQLRARSLPLWLWEGTHQAKPLPLWPWEGTHQ